MALKLGTNALNAVYLGSTSISALYLGSTQVFSAGSEFDPASLFASGEQGAWYDPSDLTTMWTDTAGTTQTTAVLDGVTPTSANRVARIDDKSGNGNHALQGSTDAQPILRVTSGGLYYLSFDGADDFMSFSSSSRPDNMHAFLGVNSPAGDSDLCLLGTSDVSYRSLFLSGSNNFIHYRGAADSDYNIYIDGNLFSGPGNDEQGATVAAEFNNTNRVLDIDNLTLTSSIFDTQLIGKLGTSYFYNGRLYGFLLTEQLTTEEATNTRAYLATRSGVVI